MQFMMKSDRWENVCLICEDCDILHDVQNVKLSLVYKQTIMSMPIFLKSSVACRLIYLFK